MKRLTSACLAAFFAVNSANAGPLCEEFTNPDTMPKKYRKLAPVLSGSATDWIITHDQMDTDYMPSEEAQFLLREIVSEFDARGSKLAILMPPPRPLVAGHTVIGALAGDNTDFNVDRVTASFNQMIDALRDAGAIAPNLLELATESSELRETFYYRHDTHWTPRGAAESAVALANEVVAASTPGFVESEIVRPVLETDDVFSERGSLADMAKAVCGVEIAPVKLAVPAFPQTAEMGLLGDAPTRPRILLAGSSFSNRYKKDAYRVADAISGALQADVVNYSVSGGGAIGSIEGIVNADLLTANDAFDLVIWELPYTEGLNDIGMLSQLLGALRFKSGNAATKTVSLDASGKVKLELDAQKPKVLALNLPNTSLQRIKADLRFSDGTKETLSLVRKSHIPAALQSDWWAVSLQGIVGADLASITLRYDADAMGASATAYLY